MLKSKNLLYRTLRGRKCRMFMCNATIFSFRRRSHVWAPSPWRPSGMWSKLAARAQPSCTDFACSQNWRTSPASMHTPTSSHKYLIIWCGRTIGKVSMARPRSSFGARTGTLTVWISWFEAELTNPGVITTQPQHCYFKWIDIFYATRFSLRALQQLDTAHVFFTVIHFYPDHKTVYAPPDKAIFNWAQESTGISVCFQKSRTSFFPEVAARFRVAGFANGFSWDKFVKALKTSKTFQVQKPSSPIDSLVQGALACDLICFIDRWTEVAWDVANLNKRVGWEVVV